MDKLSFLDGDSPAETPAVASTPAETPAETPVLEPAAQDAAPAADGRARGPDGKFVSKAPEAAPAATDASPQAPASPPVAAQPTEPARAPEGYVPLSALTELRKEFSAFKQQVQQQPAQPAPDPYEDFEAYQAWQEEQQVQERADWSRQLAEVKYGPEKVRAAQQWAAERWNDPVFRERALSTRDPYGFAIAEHQREQALQLLSDPKLLEQFQAWQAGTGAAPTPQAAALQPPPPSPIPPPPSITSAPSAGGVQHVPTGPGTAYGAIFG